MLGSHAPPELAFALLALFAAELLPVPVEDTELAAAELLPPPVLELLIAAALEAAELLPLPAFELLPPPVLVAVELLVDPVVGFPLDAADAPLLALTELALLAAPLFGPDET